MFVTEFMPFEVRTAGFSLAYSVSQALFGGFTPLICTWLIHTTGDKAVPGAWLSMVACWPWRGCSFAAKEKSRLIWPQACQFSRTWPPL